MHTTGWSSQVLEGGLPRHQGPQGGLGFSLTPYVLLVAVPGSHEVVGWWESQEGPRSSTAPSMLLAGVSRSYFNYYKVL